MFKQALALGAAALLAVPTVAQDEAKYEVPPLPTLMVGDLAPAMTVGSWIKGARVAKFAPERTYVVEFWATWCGPCKQTIPHLSELQNKLAGKNVQVIGVSVWEEDPSRVGPFVERWGDKMGYTVAMDQVTGEGEEARGAMAEGWMKAAGKRNIPTAFVVKNGRVSWIGHPMDMDEPLGRIVDGNWNLEQEAADYRREVVLQVKLAAFQVEGDRALRSGKYEALLSAMSGAIESNPEHESMFGRNKFFALVRLSKLELASAYGDHLVDNVYREDASALNFIAWTIVDPGSKIARRDYELSIKAAKCACDLTEWADPAILDTLALGLFDSGHITKALKIQQKAVKYARGGKLEQELTERLEKFERAVQKQGEVAAR